MHRDTVIELEGVNGEWFTIAGPQAGDRGVHLGTGLKGIYDPPVKVVYEEPGNYQGARYLSHRILRRDITLAFLVLDDKTEGWASRDSELRKALAYDRDAFLHVTTPESGHRKLKVRLGEALDVELETDPHLGSVVVVTALLVAGDPFWYEDDQVYAVTTTKDTRFSVSMFPYPQNFDALPQENLSINVSSLNPTDQYIWLKWGVPGSQEPVPGLPWPWPPGTVVPWQTAPFTQWVIPDYSFEDPADATRRLRMPGLIYKENCFIDTDPRVEQVTSETGSQVWARMNGVRFRYAVPPYTRAKTFNLTVTGCAPGQVASLRIPRPWSRPWGLE